jgi:hypothetical protein
MERKAIRVRGNPELSMGVVGDALGMSISQVKYALRVGRLTGLRLSDIVSYVKGRLL